MAKLIRDISLGKKADPKEPQDIMIKDIKTDEKELLVIKSNITDFATGSVVTVHESQEALFYLNGECAGVLEAGRHILETDSIPFLRQLVNFVTGKKNVFHAQVYFVNKVEMTVNWGAGGIVFEDPTGIVFTIGAHGTINLTVTNSRMLVEKLSGVADSLTMDTLVHKFQSIIISEVADTLVNTIQENQIPITNIYAHLKKVSSLLQDSMIEVFNEYGLTVPQFRIFKIKVPESDPQYQRLKKLKADKSLRLDELELERREELIRQQTEMEKIKMEADAYSYKRQTEGYTYQEERQLDVLQSAAENESQNGGNIASQMVNLGAGLGAANAIGHVMQNNVQPMVQGMVPPSQATPNTSNNNTEIKCTNCGTALPEGSKFCQECGQPTSNEIICPNCNAKTARAKFCMECGQSLV